jgi:hypothetical protein
VSDGFVIDLTQKLPINEAPPMHRHAGMHSWLLTLEYEERLEADLTQGKLPISNLLPIPARPTHVLR